MRKALLWLSLLLVVVLGVEAGSWLLYLATRQRAFSYRETRRALEALAVDGVRGEAGPVGMGEEVFRGGKLALHPYLGFCHDPTQLDLEGVPFNELGFPGPSPLAPPSPQEVRIGLFGGSVAYGVWMLGRDVLVQELESSGLFPGRELRCYCFAAGAYKQPQQLLTLAYLASLGVDLDLAVNLDGFNEVVLPPTDVLPGSPAEYPRAWSDYTRRALDPHKLRALGEVAALQHRRRALAARILHSPLRYSVAACVAWKAVDRRLTRKLAEADAGLNLALAVPPAGGRRRTRYASEAEMLEELARIWAASSRAMHDQLTGAGREYYHFLQPNQYVEGSKPLTATELSEAFLADHPYRRWVSGGYPHLLAGGARLRDAGVAFFDLTRLFADSRDEVYADSCCHFTAAANRAIARAMARDIVAWKRGSEPHR